jgi:hypothetical protein
LRFFHDRINGLETKPFSYLSQKILSMTNDLETPGYKGITNLPSSWILASSGLHQLSYPGQVLNNVILVI